MQEINAYNRVNAPDTYQEWSTLRAPGTKRITIFIYNNAALYQLATDPNGSVWGTVESELPPGFHSLGRNCSGFRFRNLLSQSVAIVSVKMLA